MPDTNTQKGEITENQQVGFLITGDPARYKIEFVHVDEIHPSPENVDVYGEIDIDSDPELIPLMESIRRMGLEEPIVVTTDGFILSGHRRYVCCRLLEWKFVPIRRSTVCRAQSADYHRLLVQYNPQRLKTVKTILAERFISGPEFRTESDFRTLTFKKAETTATFVTVAGVKTTTVISEKRREFLEAVVRVVDDLREFWPLSIRTIHYRLLNNPPLTQVTKTRDERWRYRNEKSCYSLLSELCVSARYEGHVALEAIDDPTRVCEDYEYTTHQNPAAFIDAELQGFLTGYRRSILEGQADKFMLPRSISRGYGNPSVWNKMADRFTASGAKQLILLTISDHDPEGFDLVDDAIRSLRDLHGVPVKSVRVGLNMSQVEAHGAHPAFAKESSSRFTQYVTRTGSSHCWEIEAVDPHYLQAQLHDAILSVLDVEQIMAVQDLQRVEIQEISEIRRRLRPAVLAILKGEGGAAGE